jgi:hypothetical protein
MLAHFYFLHQACLATVAYADLYCRSVLFHRDGRFPSGATAEPLREWPMESMLDFKAGPAANDVYGKMFFYLRDMFVKFQEESKRFDTQVVLTAVANSCLWGQMDGSVQYDRIEVSALQQYVPWLAKVRADG